MTEFHLYGARWIFQLLVVNINIATADVISFSYHHHCSYLENIFLITCVFHSVSLVPQLPQSNIKKLIQEVLTIEGLYHEFEKSVDRQNEQLKCLQVRFYHILHVYRQFMNPSL